MLLPILVIKSNVWVSCNIHTNQKKEGVYQEYQVSQSTYQALLKFERLLLRVSVSPLTNLPSKLTLPFPTGLHAMVETTMQSDAENLYPATISPYQLPSRDLYIPHVQQPCCRILLEHDREEGHSIPVAEAERPSTGHCPILDRELRTEF